MSEQTRNLRRGNRGTGHRDPPNQQRAAEDGGSGVESLVGLLPRRSAASDPEIFAAGLIRHSSPAIRHGAVELSE